MDPDDSTLTVTAALDTGPSINAQVTVKTGTGGDHLGLSSYPRTDAGAYNVTIIDDIIDVMDSEHLDMYRMSVYATQPLSTFYSMVQHYLDSCSYDLIICRHIYDPGGSVDSWSNVQSWALSMAAHFSAYQDRLWLEPINEVGDADLGARMQVVLDAVRAAGYTHRIVANKWNQSWASMAAVTDTQNRFYTGYHYYFNSWTTAGAQSQMQNASAAGIPYTRLINTEIGADYNEASAFSESEVQSVTQFMYWCAARGIGNTVWQRYGLQNWVTYQQYNLTFPVATTVWTGVTPTPAITLDPDTYYLTVVYNNTAQYRSTTVYSDQYTLEPFTFTGPITPPPEQSYQVQLLGASGGSTVPGSGLYTLFLSQAFTATAYAAAEYLFSKWLRDNADYATTKTVSFPGYNGVTYVLQPVFTYSGGGEPGEEPPGDWRNPNPYEPDPSTTPLPAPTSPSLPSTMPDPAVIVGSGTLFTLLKDRMSQTQPLTLTDMMKRVQQMTPPDLTNVMKQLKRGRYTA